MSHDVNEANHELVVAGEQRAVSAYVKLLAGLQKKGQLLLKEKATVRYRRSSTLRCNLPPALLEKIWESLPPRPWSRDLHKTVATEFNVSKTQAWAAIGLFLQAKGQRLGQAAGPEPPNNGMQTDGAARRS